MAMVVAYHPGPGFLGLVDSLVCQFGKVMVVDNGDCGTTRKMLNQAVHPERIEQLCNGGNIGIGEALNRGLQYAQQHGYQWLVSFDHDSQIGTEFAQVLFEATSWIESDNKPIAVIGPSWQRVNGQSDMSHVIESNSGRYCPITTLITSGSCINVDTALRLGGFRGDYFIDAVDQEFCLRANTCGCQVLLDRHLTMAHCLGEESAHSLFGKSYWVTNHSVIRRYYMSRNKLLLWCRFLWVFPKWVLEDIKWYGVELMKLLVFEKHKTKKILAVLLGGVHAVAGVRGKLQARYTRFLEL